MLTSVVNAQLFAFSYPLWVALFAALVLGHRLLGGFAVSAITGQFLVVHALGRLPVTFAQ